MPQEAGTPTPISRGVTEAIQTMSAQRWNRATDETRLKMLAAFRRDVSREFKL